MAVTVLVDGDTLIEMLMDRVRFWTEDKDVLELYYIKYQNLVKSGALEGTELDIFLMVDNDYVNYCVVIDKDDCTEADWEKLMEMYEQGDTYVDSSDFEELGYTGTIEAVTDNQRYLLLCQ